MSHPITLFDRTVPRFLTAQEGRGLVARSAGARSAGDDARVDRPGDGALARASGGVPSIAARAAAALATASSFAHAARRSARASLRYLRRSMATSSANIARNRPPRRRSASISAAENGKSDGAPAGAGTGRSGRSRIRSRTRSPSPPSQPCSVVKWSGPNCPATSRSASGVATYRFTAAATTETAYVFRGTRSEGSTRNRRRHAPHRAIGTDTTGVRPVASPSPRKIAPRLTRDRVSSRRVLPHAGHGVRRSQSAIFAPP